MCPNSSILYNKLSFSAEVRLADVSWMPLHRLLLILLTRAVKWSSLAEQLSPELVRGDGERAVHSWRPAYTRTGSSGWVTRSVHAWAVGQAAVLRQPECRPWLFLCPGVRSDAGRKRRGSWDLIREQDGEDEVQEDGKDGGREAVVNRGTVWAENHLALS